MNSDEPMKAIRDNSLPVISFDDYSPLDGETSQKPVLQQIENSTPISPRPTDAVLHQRGHQVLPDPSSEQRDIIRAVREGQCVTIRACAGSGKTTCMLQVAASLPERRRALIITYNRSLADECKERIQRLSLGHRAKCYTIHGLASRFAAGVCNDDHKLMRQLDRWDNGLDMKPSYPMPLDLVMIDEAQDLRPLFHRILSRIFGIAGGGGIQLCLVGDPKQMLYDFPTYGDDKASTSFFLEPETYWGKFTQKRTWTHLPLSVSYRLTPNIASFCNLFWGTSMVGGNTSSPNIPVEYLIKYPYPNTRGGDDDEKLNTSVLAEIINQHGPENVMFLAQSVKRSDLPIRVHVNELMKIKDTTTGMQQYNFHIKESVRGFEGTPDWKNKVRVWTFCGSKGCEADVVVVFGLDIYARPHALNQIGVALSRARKRLLVIHSKKYESRKCLTMPYYPVLGDCPTGMEQHIVRFGKDNLEEINLRVPAIESPSTSVPSGLQTYAQRCELTKRALARLAKSGVITLDAGSNSSNSVMPKTTGVVLKQTNQAYVASEFNYFSALAETNFLKFGAWTKIAVDGENHKGKSTTVEGDAIHQGRINYETNVQFKTTTEDVSALYGEAVVYMLQWELCRFVPNIETIVSNGILGLHPHVSYSEAEIREQLRNMCCEELTPKDEETLTKEFLGNKRIKGQDLIPFVNNRMSIKKKKIRKSGAEGDLADGVVFPVKATEKKNADDDNHLTEFLPQIKSLYECETSAKKPFHWIYLANAVMAFSNYHEKFRQIGTDPNSYESWVDSRALICGLERLRNIMKVISPSSTLEIGCANKKNNSVDTNTSAGANVLEGTSSFEHELSIDFVKEDCITEQHNGMTIVGVTGVCDWINERRTRCVKAEKEERMHDVDLLEIKFVHNLSNVHRLQVLVYTALYALKVNNVKTHNGNGDDGHQFNFNNEQETRLINEYGQGSLDTFSDDEDNLHNIYSDGDNSNNNNDQFEWKVEYCRGMLYNARTGEMEFCSIQSRNAMDFLLDISQFKYNGKDRKDLKQEQKAIDSKKQIRGEDSLFAPNYDVASTHRLRMPKKRLKQNTGKSYYTPLCVDDDDESTIKVPTTTSTNSRSPRVHRLKKRRKKIPQTTLEEGTDRDPIILD